MFEVGDYMNRKDLPFMPLFITEKKHLVKR